MKKVFRNIISSVLFLSILAALLMTASAIMKPSKRAGVNSLEDPLTNGVLAERKNTIDVVFLGDSECYSTFIPLKIWNDHGITSYVCGTTEQVLSYSYELLTKTEKKQDPKIVVLETNTVFREVTSTKAFINKAEGLFSVFKYHDRWKNLQPKSWQINENKIYDERSKGYLFNTIVNAASTQGYMTPTDEKETIPTDNVKYVKKIRDYCRKNGAELVLVSVPSTKNWNYAKHNAIAELSDNLGIEYVDMNTLRKEIPIDWKNETRDKGDHLNYYGAVKATSYIGKYLEASGLFESKKNDPEYAEWNRFAADFYASAGDSAV